jgi:hypothetical protein
VTVSITLPEKNVQNKTPLKEGFYHQIENVFRSLTLTRFREMGIFTHWLL